MKLTEPQALNKAAAYCSKAERCEFDVRKKLIAWELSEESIFHILKRLKDERFLSNERFCRSFINDKVQFNKWGRTKIVYELRKRNIAETDYLPHLEQLPDDEFEKQLIRILQTKIKSVKAKNDYEKKTKLIRFALGRGFPMDLAIKCVNKLMGGDYESCF
ncbi:MAG: regulatory protein RecX [Dysgonomonas sp.]